MNGIAVDFGGTTIKAAIFKDGVIVKRGEIPAHSQFGLAARLPDTQALVSSLLAGERLTNFSYAGLAFPGIVDAERKKVLGVYEKYEDSMRLDLGAWCQTAFGLPMIMGMDSKLALQGEMYCGCAKGFRDAAMLILGTGVGTAVAMNGEILTSRNHVAGALSSHIIIDLHGPSCTCPNAGCLEAMASGWALEGLVKRQPGYPKSGLACEKTLDFRVLKTWYQRQDPVAVRVVEACVAAWRAGILNLIHAYDPEIVVLSGAIMNFEGLYEMLTDKLAQQIWDCCGNVEIRQAAHPTDSVLYGLYYQMDCAARLRA